MRLSRKVALVVGGALVAGVPVLLSVFLPAVVMHLEDRAAPTMQGSHQEGAPYPADMDHLDQILATGDGHALPEGAQVTSVTPAVEFTKSYPRGWGYVIAFTATDPAIRQYVTERTIHSGDIIEKYPTTKPGNIQLSDLNLDEINTPWDTGFTDGVLVLERPLGRGWLIINGSSR